MNSHLDDGIFGNGGSNPDAAGPKPIPDRFGFPNHLLPEAQPRYSVWRTHGFYDTSDIPAEQSVTTRLSLPEHQRWMERGRMMVEKIMQRRWVRNPVIGELGWYEAREQGDIPHLLAHPDNPCRAHHPGLTTDEHLWYLEGALGNIMGRGRGACREDIIKGDRQHRLYLPEDRRSLLPVPLPDDVWARAEHDLPLVDMPERPYEGLIRNVLHPSLEEVAPSGVEKVRAWQAAAQRLNALETEHMIALAWWRGYRQQMIDHNHSIQQRTR